MKYNHLGKAGIKVSELSFGSWLTFGNILDQEQCKQCIRAAYDAGVNFFDTAEVYAGGEAERLMGKALKEFRRESLVISTKVFWGGEGPNDTGLSWKHIMEGTKNSLKRLDLDYVDVLFCHRPDPSTPMEETVRAMDRLIRQGHVFYWGTSMWSALQIEQAYTVALQMNAIPPVVEQPRYNMLSRNKVEEEFSSLYDKFGLGTTVFSPLAQGLLSGKYMQSIPPGSRFEKEEHLARSVTEETMEVLRSLSSLSQELSCSMAQLAIAWCLKNDNVSSVILGASSSSQLSENLASLQVKDKLDDSVMSKIENILQTHSSRV